MDELGGIWLHLRGKGDRKAEVALPSVARGAPYLYLMQWRLPVVSNWEPNTALIGSLDDEKASVGSTSGISAARL